VPNMLERVELALGTSALLAGIGLCGAIVVMAIKRYRRDADIKSLLVSLAAALVAPATGFFTLLVVFIHVQELTSGPPKFTAGRALFTYFSVLVSIPLGMGWGWVLNFVRRPGDAAAQRASDFAVRGLAYGMLAASTFQTVDLVARLIGHGHDNSIAAPGLAAALVFLGVTLLASAGMTLNIRNLNAGHALREAAIGVGCAVLLALGIFIAAVAVGSLFLGLNRLVEAWNVLIFFYPFYLGGSLALAAVMVFYGGRLFARTWSRLSLA
jgi:hypothetical protein